MGIRCNNRMPSDTRHSDDVALIHIILPSMPIRATIEWVLTVLLAKRHSNVSKIHCRDIFLEDAQDTPPQNYGQNY